MKRKLNTHGGARPGAGRPKEAKTISEESRARWLEAAEDFRKKHGVTVERAILELIVANGVQDSVRVAAANLYSEALLASTKADAENPRSIYGPVIGLPPRYEDPVKVVQGGKE
jgi:hypothetical protein